MTDKSIKIKLEQLNFTVGDLDGNCQKIINAFEKSKNEVDLIVFSELAITGYFPEDLLYKNYFIEASNQKINELIDLTRDSNCAILVGAPYQITNKHHKKLLYNSAFLIKNGGIEKIICKNILPNYGVFDEQRYFASDMLLSVVEFNGLKLAILICEDIWSSKNAFLLADKNIDAIISINASPFFNHKAKLRLETVRKFVQNINKPVIYVNQIGGQDSIVFDGSSFVLNEDGQVILKMAEFGEDSSLITLDKYQVTINSNHKNYLPKDEDQLYSASVLALRDYVYKNGFEKVVIGMSGGIDSALVAAIAVDALGNNKVKLVALPSKYNSSASLNDALKMSKNLAINLDQISIEPTLNAMLTSLSDEFAGTNPGIAEENIQSRIRGNLLMALSNKLGHLLITTGNKSEMATGYATIYGDMCGAFNPIKDLYKTEIFKLAKWRNNNIPQISFYQKINLIPENIITKEPSAELRENQKDSDSLPAYEILDQILFNLIEEEKSIEQIIKLGFDEKIVKKVAKLFYSSEYKRRQAAIGPKLSKMSFDKERRYPITNKFWN